MLKFINKLILLTLIALPLVFSTLEVQEDIDVATVNMVDFSEGVLFALFRGSLSANLISCFKLENGDENE